MSAPRAPRPKTGARQLALLALAALVGATLGLSEEGRWSHPELGPGSRRLVIEAPDAHWSREGFVELVTPLAPPTRRDGGSRIEIWVRLPVGARFTTDEAGALRWPEGAEADRVERLRVDGRWVVGDVRGVRIGEGGLRHMRLLRPERPGAGARLVGYEWSEATPGLERAAHAALAELIRAGGGRAHGGVSAERAASLLASRSGCVACHAKGRPARARVGEGVPFRATDGDGFYSPLAVMGDAQPLERYRPRDPNLLRPAVRARCPDGSEALHDADGRGGLVARCAEGALPTASLDFEAGLASDEPRARGACASRRWLADHMDAPTRESFADALAPCRASEIHALALTHGEER